MSESKISIASLSLQYGITCFGGLRVYKAQGAMRVFRLKDHYHRLMTASKILGMNFFIEWDTFKTIINDFIVANKPTSDFYLRPFVFSKTEQIAPRPSAGLVFELALYGVQLGNYFDPNKGMRLMISSWRKFSDDALPTKAKAGGCYINSFLASSQAMQAGYDEALLLDQDGFVAEASVANLLIVYNDRIIMPPVGSAILDGITMRTVIEILKEENVPVFFEKIDRSMIYSAQEILLMGTAAQISFVQSVDDRPINGHLHSLATGPGSLAKMLRGIFSDIVAGKHKLSATYLFDF